MRQEEVNLAIWRQEVLKMKNSTNPSKSRKRAKNSWATLHLQKYYNNAELYTVTEGSVSCKARWHLRLDNDHSDYLAVFLGDLGRDLPEPERQYWKGFNIARRDL
jgi:hypothetical protein